MNCTTPRASAITSYPGPATLPEQIELHTQDPFDLHRVRKIVFRKTGPKQVDRSTIIYNEHVQLWGIPEKAYEYVVNGKSAIEWLMERYQVTEDKRSGIVNDPNQWMAEQGNPRYLVDLIKRVVRVSMETLRIVKELPDLVVGE